MSMLEKLPILVVAKKRTDGSGNLLPKHVMPWMGKPTCFSYGRGWGAPFKSFCARKKCSAASLHRHSPSVGLH